MELNFLARLPKGEDILKAITDEFLSRSIKTGSFVLIGALTKVVIGFYDPIERRYSFREFHGAHEIVSCVGNISEKDGQIFAHAHIVVSDHNLQCLGGHLGEGSLIFAAELFGTESRGPSMVRQYDEATGLMLWTKTSVE
jgi:predicted DNA-binding protein with PD1-like motif